MMSSCMAVAGWVRLIDEFGHVHCGFLREWGYGRKEGKKGGREALYKLPLMHPAASACRYAIDILYEGARDAVGCETYSCLLCSCNFGRTECWCSVVTKYIYPNTSAKTICLIYIGHAIRTRTTAS